MNSCSIHFCYFQLFLFCIYMYLQQFIWRRQKFIVLLYQQFVEFIRMRLSDVEKLRYSKIIFNTQGKQRNQIDSLTYEQLDIIRSLYAQKIAYETVNRQIEQFNEQGYTFVIRRPNIPNFFASLCCCCFPEENRDIFDITTNVFLQRLFYPFLFWRNQFLNINNGKPQKYGIVWIIFTFTIIVSLAANLNYFFVHPSNFKFSNQLLMRAVGIVSIFKIAEPLIYSASIGCLGGYIQFNHAFMLTSYSLGLEFIPTIMCFVPSLYWHLLMLAAGSSFRGIFLYRNFVSKLQSREYILFFVICIIEAIYVYLMIRSVFVQDAGYGFTEGFNAVFPAKPTINGQAKKTQGHLFAYTFRQYQN